ncbi:Xaa-Pro dipeptidyl-peptidase [Companilactobacillus allii]|uniref:Xaa-Pro dipeptidyl-peptidase n=1 Tax=Companilactobacillus allii TaxID=1847728 RepID=A0A1P8PZY1_9LACO|nr:Xaa-Pro dipeptidyl-peptidase [Companilactobacillus allii]APX71111.1 Xaa-Pro dipeptidyl-peptidase [Companilactobacillus allii]USQ68188.1 Xaa-Pro dipeptidyl-peptidase [Companilactobacillus allii]
MKNNQFAIRPTNFDTQIKELQDIHFLTSNNEMITDPIDLFKDFLRISFLEANSKAVFEQKLSSYMATPTQNALEYLNSNNELSVESFYNIALQLLKFNPDVDFSFEDPLGAMKKIQLNISDHEGVVFTLNELKSAWYYLLATHNKNGQTFIDSLAARGYFTPFYGDVGEPLLFNGKTMPVFDPHKTIREVVYVESPQDTDNDGKLDLLKAEILRPYESNSGLKVPSLYTASPYNQGTNDETGEKVMHNVNIPLERKEPNNLSYDDIKYVAPQKKLPNKRTVNSHAEVADETFSREQSYTLNDYFLARGFAIVYAAGIGTKDSDGIRTTGDPQETTSTVSIIEWLAGNRRAFTNKSDNIEIKAWWSNKHIAMTGRSYLGTLATAAATSGVKGLKTVISEAAISSWYDYYRDGGLVIAPGGFPGEDADVLAEETLSRRLQPGDFYKIQPFWDKKLQEITDKQDRASGNYNTFWDARNYHKNFKNIKADVLMVHGLNDWNVKPRNVERLWNGIRNNGVIQKIILHQGQHIYINAFRSIDYTDIINLWLTHELLDIDNQAEKIIPDVIIQDNVQPETWNKYSDWSNKDNQKIKYNLSDDKLSISAPTNETLTFSDQLNSDLFDRYKNHNDTWQHDLVDISNNNMTHNRLLFTTNNIEETVIDGIVKINLNVASSEDLGMLSFQLIDYGLSKRLKVSPTLLSKNGLAGTFDWREDDLREFELGEPTDYKMITKGHVNLQNRDNAYRVNDLEPNTFYPLSVELQPTFYRVPKDHKLGLIIYSTDFGMTVRGNKDIKYSIQTGESNIVVPIHSDTII